MSLGLGKRDAALIWIRQQAKAGLSTIGEGEQFYQLWVIAAVAVGKIGALEIGRGC